MDDRKVLRRRIFGDADSHAAEIMGCSSPDLHEVQLHKIPIMEVWITLNCYTDSWSYACYKCKPRAYLLVKRTGGLKIELKLKPNRNTVANHQPIFPNQTKLKNQTNPHTSPLSLEPVLKPFLSCKFISLNSSASIYFYLG